MLHFGGVSLFFFVTQGDIFHTLLARMVESFEQLGRQQFDSKGFLSSLTLGPIHQSSRRNDKLSRRGLEISILILILDFSHQKKYSSNFRHYELLSSQKQK